MLYAKINGTNIPIISGSINWSLSAVSGFSVVIYANEIDWQNMIYEDIEIFYKNISLITGFIDKRLSLEINESKQIVITLDCVNDLGRLSCLKSRYNTHFQNVALNTALTTLIGTAPGWALDLTTLSNPATTITIDLRNNETLFSQISDVIALIPGTFFRYGGIVGGNHILEIGDLNTDTKYVDRGFNMISIQLDPQEEKFYSQVRGFTGEIQNGAGLKVVLTLAQALVDARYLASPLNVQFPITLLADGSYVVSNNNFTSSCSITKFFSDIVPQDPNVNTTGAQRSDLSFMLYLACVKFLKEHEPNNLFAIKYHDSHIPKVGDSLRVNIRVDEEIYDDNLAFSMKQKLVFQVNNENYRITQLTLDLSEITDGTESATANIIQRSEFIMNAVVSGNDGLGYFDPEISMYRKLLRKMQRNAYV